MSSTSLRFARDRKSVPVDPNDLVYGAGVADSNLLQATNICVRFLALCFLLLSHPQLGYPVMVWHCASPKADTHVTYTTVEGAEINPFFI
jgi:hypothetical protein